MNFFPKKNLTRKKGFTLTEVLIVVLVISVLAAIAYPIYTKSATKSRAVEAINLLEMVRNKQLIKFARDKAYYTNVASLGQITSNKKQESVSEQELKIKDYTLSLNAAKNCATAAYEKGTIKFSFSSGYENTGLGCTGDICASFGNIIGGASDVCNCNGATPCGAGFVRNQDTCACECKLCLINGTCVAPTQTQATSRACGNSGTQVRSCTASCDGGTCGPWGACTGQSCPLASKPAASEACGNCGTHTRTVTCDGNSGTWTTTAWGSCTGEGVCTPNATQSCGSGGTQTCTSSCQWPTACVEPPCPATCSDGYVRTSATTGNSSTCCTCPSPKTTKLQNGACDVNGNCQASKFICTCPNSNDYTKCTTTGGTWNDTTCSCLCPESGFHPFDSTTGCACPSGKEWRNWRYYTGNPPPAKQCICSNAIDQSATAGASCDNSVSASNDMEARCKALFCQPQDCSLSTGCRFLTASEAVSYASLKTTAQQTAAGTWNSTSCTCTCPGGGTLTNGRCYMCAFPLTWNGSSCVCPSTSCNGGSLNPTTCQCTCPQGSTYMSAGGGATYLLCYGTNYQYATMSVTSAGCYKSCGYGFFTSPTGSCTCLGLTTLSNGQCVLKSGAASPSACKTNWTLSHTCGSGNTFNCYCTGNFELVNGECLPKASGNCNESTKPAASQSCGNCSTGTQTRTVTCVSGSWTTGSWSTCSGGGTCTPGATQACGDNGTKTCSSSCAWGTCQDCNNYEYKVNHKSTCCPLVSLEEDDGTCYNRTWSSYGGQAIGYGGCWAPEGGTQSCMADSSKRYACIEDTDQYIPCNNDGDVCACMACGGYGQSTFINTINYMCSITHNGW